MSKQDKAISERHTKTLRELVKRPENKVCADCKRNDPRWASWNIGVFLCIKCSGIHRGMGTHISRVKSVDLDIWTPEQIESIQLWGNARANLYWEAHLKPGHVPPEHKMESFIRSKYESRRWALDGPRPKDPSVLENPDTGSSEPVLPTPPEPQSLPAKAAVPRQREPHTTSSSRIRSNPSATVKRQSKASPPGVTAQETSITTPQDDLFSLDFHGSPASASPPSAGPPISGHKDVKNTILSLFAASQPSGGGVLGGGGTGLPVGQSPPGTSQFTNTTSMVGNTGTGMWGVQSGWNDLPTGQPHLSQNNLWGQTPSGAQQQSFDTFSGNFQPQNPGLLASNVWAGQTHHTQSGVNLFTDGTQSAKKDDAFGDLWGSFK